MFDSHCHLHDERMAEVREAAIARARGAGVRGFMLAGVDPKGWRVEAALAERHPDVAVSYGVHPQLVPLATPDECRAMVAALERAVLGGELARPHAVGEIGLDGYTPERKAALPLQEEIFRAQLDVARRADLPVILHVLGPHGRALEVLRDAGVPEAGGVVHSYSGSGESVRHYLDLGLHISFAGVVTQSRARRSREAAVRVPIDRLLVETDAPDQTPAARAPSPNEPAYVVDVVRALAELRGVDAAELGRATEANARRLFRIV